MLSTETLLASWSLTPRFSGVGVRQDAANCFSSFPVFRKTVETVFEYRSSRVTPLNRGVNERNRPASASSSAA